MKLLALDSNSILNRAFYGIKLLSTKNGEYTNAVYGFLNILLKLLEETKPDMVACAFDLKAPTFRHKMYDGYKAQRKGMPQELAAQLPIIKELLTCLGYKIVELEGYEADDILGTLAYSCCQSGDSCVIATGDRDSLQLVHDCVTVRLASTKAGKAESTLYTTEEIIEKYGVSPKELIQVKALMGDASDNIPGVAGVGEKTALSLVQTFKTLENIYENIDDEQIKKGVREKLIQDKDMAFLSRELATINCQVPIDISLDSYKIAEGNKAQALAILKRLEMFAMIKKWDLTDDGTANIVEDTGTVEIKQVKVLPYTHDALKTKDIVYLSVELSAQGVPNGFVLLADNVVYHSKDIANIAETLFEIMSISPQIVTDRSKALYKEVFKATGNPLLCLFDTELAGYLLSPSAKDYSPKRLCEEYGCQPKYSYPSELDFAVDEIFTDVLYINAVFEKLKALISEQDMNMLYYDIELPLALVLASMESYGFELDIEGITAFGNEIEKDIQRLTQEIYTQAGQEFNINSPKQLGDILFDVLKLSKGKKTKTGYSTNADVLESLQHENPIVKDILEYRKLAKLKSTYVDGLLREVDSTGHIHTSFQQTETRTGRISSTEPNLQNIPVRTELGANLRRFFKAGEGMTLVDADYSQIELRVLADMSDDENMCTAFINDEDIHTKTAAEVFGMPPLFITSEMRSRAKAVNFGIVYGIGAFSLAQDIGVSVSEADKYIKGYLKTYEGVKKYMDRTIAQGTELGYVTTLYGRRRYLPELKATNKIQKSFGERVAMNMPIQGTAADIIKIAMVKVYNRLAKENLKSKLILQVHDELIVESIYDEAELVKKLVREEMEAAAQLKVPLIAEAKSGKTWFDAK